MRYFAPYSVSSSVCCAIRHYTVDGTSEHTCGFGPKDPDRFHDLLLKAAMPSQSGCESNRTLFRTGNETCTVVVQLPTVLKVLLPTVVSRLGTALFKNFNKNSHTTTNIPKTLPVQLQIQIL